MSPSGGLITTVDPCMMWSPVNSVRSSLRRKHRWLDACPGVWRAVRWNSVASITDLSASVPSRRTLPFPSPGPNARTSAPVRLLQAGRAGGVVLVGVGEQDPADAVAAAAGDGVEVGVVAGPGVDDRDLVDADQVGVGAGAGHHPRVRCHDAADHGRQGAGHAVDERLRFLDGGVVAHRPVSSELARHRGSGRLFPALDVPDVDAAVVADAAARGAEPAEPVGDGDAPPLGDVPQHRDADDRTGGRKEQQERQHVADEPGGDHQRAGQEDEAAVDQLGAGGLPRSRASWMRREHADALALGEPGAEQRDGDEQADRVGDADAAGDLHDDGQLDDGSDDEEQEEDQCHAVWVAGGVGGAREAAADQLEDARSGGRLSPQPTAVSAPPGRGHAGRQRWHHR